MDGFLSLVLHPAAIVVTFAGRGDDRRINQRAGLHLDCLRLELGCHHRVEQAGIQITQRDARI